MNHGEAEAAADALHAALLRIKSKRANWLVIADHDRVLTKLVELGETFSTVVTAANTLASECFSNDAALVSRLSDSFGGVQVRVSAATDQLLEARKAVRREVLQHRDEAPPRGERRWPWMATSWGDVVVGPLTNATTAAWALTRPRAEGDASDLSEHFWLAAGLARMTAELWQICVSEETNIASAYSGVKPARSGERAQDSVSRAGREWHKGGMALMGTMAILRKRARDRGAALERPQALAAVGGGA